MSSNPGDEPDNPFKGTPFEQFFGSGNAPDLSGILSQMQGMMAPHDGPVNWQLVEDIARRSAATSSDPSPTRAESDAVADAIRLADLWLDDTTEFSSGVRSTAAWSRAEWITSTIPNWKPLVEPMAEQMGSTLTSAMPEEMREMTGPLAGILGQLGGSLYGTQTGSGLGALAGEVLTASDIGIPLGPEGCAALVPHNVAAFADGLAGVEADDVRLYLALREAAHQRLYAHVPWLREHLVGAVAEYACGVEIDTTAIEQLRNLNPMDPAAMQEALSGGIFEPKKTPAQQAALRRLDTALALVEGWVDEVVGQATQERMPTAGKLQEAVRRLRASGGPAEQTFSALVGLELRPRRLRDASTLWGSLRTRQGTEARDAVWLHPDLLPTSEDLDDPLGFREDLPAADELSGDDFDAALRKLLEEGSGGTGDSGGTDDDPDA